MNNETQFDTIPRPQVQYFLILWLLSWIPTAALIWWLEGAVGSSTWVTYLPILCQCAWGILLWKMLSYRQDSIHRQEALHRINAELEQRVIQRTQDLEASNANLQKQVEQTQLAQTEKEDMRNLLLQAQKMEAMGSLAGGIAHDFNNLLTIILGYAELAVLFIDDKEKARDAIQTSLDAGEQARQLVQQILTFSRKQSHENAPVIIVPVVKEALKLVRSSLPSTIEIEQDISSETASIIGNTTHLHQLIMNLCTNASHAMEKQGKGKLTVTLGPAPQDVAQEKLGAPDGIMLVIRDTGHGMDEETRRQIFEPYFTTKDQDKGTGLGLSVVHGIVQQWNGVIEVDSELGRGTEFRIYVPSLISDSIEEEATESMTESGIGHVLFVDDEINMTKLGKTMLEHVGYTVTAHNDPQQAMEEFSASPQRFDVLITDFTMPHLTGTELIEQMRALRPDLPTVLSTGYSFEKVADQIEQNMIDVYLDKPYSVDQLHRAINDAQAAHAS